MSFSLQDQTQSALTEPSMAAVRAFFTGQSLILVKDTESFVSVYSFHIFTRDGFSMARQIVRPFNRKLLPERLGHEVIDSDHMEISNCWYRTVNCGPLQFPFLIARMKKLMQKHFACEAEIMKRFDRSLPACHQTEHDLLLQFCDNAAKLSQYSWAKAQGLLRRDFPRHVREHIICMDQLVVLYVNTHGELGSCRKTGSCLREF
jgi:hemerythrin